MSIKFTIDRSKWGRGQLLSAEGRMCAMGFLGEKIGVPKGEMLRKGGPETNKALTTPETLDKWASVGLVACENGRPTCTDTVNRIIEANDSLRYAETREEKLKEIFKGIGVEVEFVGSEHPDFYHR